MTLYFFLNFCPHAYPGQWKILSVQDKRAHTILVVVGWLELPKCQNILHWVGVAGLLTAGVSQVPGCYRVKCNTYVILERWYTLDTMHFAIFHSNVNTLQPFQVYWYPGPPMVHLTYVQFVH